MNEKIISFPKPKALEMKRQIASTELQSIRDSLKKYGDGLNRGTITLEQYGELVDRAIDIVEKYQA